MARAPNPDFSMKKIMMWLFLVLTTISTLVLGYATVKFFEQQEINMLWLITAALVILFGLVVSGTIVTTTSLGNRLSKKLR